MVVVKAVIIFFLGLFMISRFAELGGTKEKRDLKTEILYIIEIALSIAGIIWLFKV